MATVKYIWGSIEGANPVPCDIKEKKDDRYRIEFFDSFIEEMTERWVKAHDLQFPHFSEMIYC